MNAEASQIAELTYSSPAGPRPALNRVPEVTMFFWVIKVLCTTVGESFADYVNTSLGFGLTKTALLFSAILAAVMVAQFRQRRYVPGVYWLAVVLISVVGTLLTDELTDGQQVPLWISTTVFAILLSAVFAVWYARERTLSIHSITTPSRGGFYWLSVRAIIISLSSGVSCRRAGSRGWCSSSSRETRGAAGAGPRMPSCPCPGS